MKNFKKILSILLILMLLMEIYGINNTYAQSLPNIKGYSYIVMDANTGKVLYSKNKNKKIYPASTTKILTAAIAIENHKSSQKFIATKSNSSIPKYCSNAKIKIGEKFTFNDLLHMTMLPSAGDASNLITAGTCGNIKKGVSLANNKIKQLGLKNTHYQNTIGLDIGNGYKKHYSTAYDAAVIARYGMSFKQLRDVVAKPSYTVPKTNKSKKRKLINTNKFYSVYNNSSFMYKIIGTKTGTTNAAKSVLIVTAIDSNQHEIICGIFGSPNSRTLYSDMSKLLNYTFNQIENNKITVSKGFYDVRFTKTEDLINKYCDQDALLACDDGSFKPKQIATLNDFTYFINKISDSSLYTVDNNDPLTPLVIAQLLSKDYNLLVTDNDMEIIKDYILNTDITDQEITLIAFLNKTNIISINENNKLDIYKKLTRNDMILLGDSIKNYIQNYISN